MRWLPLATTCLLLSACGGGGAEPRSPATDLRVVIWPDGRAGDAFRATLVCDPSGGDHPDPAAACRALAGRRDALEPVPPDAICTQIYGGPEEAEVTGTLEGRRVRASFNKRNGCEIARWQRLAPLLAVEPR